MVYIAGDGSIHESAPWSLKRVMELIYGVFYFVIFFFKTLVGLDVSSCNYKGPRSGGSSFRGSSGSGGGGGGGGSGGGPFRPGGGGGGPSSRIRTMRDINPPTMGGCPGGACGL